MHSEIVTPSFGPNETVAALAFIGRHRRTLTMAEFAAGARSDLDICVRHDVDHDLGWAVAFAEAEQRLGIRSTYFVLPTAPYWRSSARARVEAIAAAGHEVGIHNDALCAAAGDVAAALALLRQWADEIRSWGLPVWGVCDHGGAPFSNPSIWNEHIPSEASFTYEAYQAHHICANYISDNRGTLRAPLADVPGRQTHMLMHPCHWELP